MHMNRIATLVALALPIVAASPAMAYVGPGAGLSAIGSVLAFLGVIFLMILGFFWYPVKRIIGRFRGAPQADDPEIQDAQ